MGIIIDVVLIAIVVVSAFFAYRKGFIKTIFSLLSMVVAVILAISFSTPVGKALDEKFVKPAVKGYILEAINGSSVNKGYEDALADIDVIGKIKGMPSTLKSALSVAGISENEIIAKANSFSVNSNEAKNQLIDSIASPISGTISKVVATVVLFVVFAVLLFFVSKLLSAVIEMIPFGKGLNKTGGMLFGLLRGLIIVFLLGTLILSISKGMPSDSNNIFSKKSLQTAGFTNAINSINPINMVLGLK